ncbi:MAG TPA: hypothetical protein DDY23_04400 [Lachnospiraceae bacterium]|nr:hypothetical protein [Lachnospiraceae bacterium]
MKKLLNVIKKIICVFGGIILLLVIQISISSILYLINPTEEDTEEKKELEVEAVYTGGPDSIDTEEELPEDKIFYATVQEAIQNSMIGRNQGEEYRKNIDHVIATFENNSYITMLYQSHKGTDEICRDWVKLKKEKVEGKDRYAFIETYPVTMFRKSRTTKYSEYDMVGHDLWTGDYYMQDLSAYSKEKRFASGDVMKYGLRENESINKLTVEGQKPDGIVEYKNFGEVWYFWYYTDLKSRKKGTELNYTLGGKDNE